MKVGDTVTATINLSADIGLMNPTPTWSGTVNGIALSNFTMVASNIYAATFSIVNGGADVAGGG
jgi:hypothetical protein